MANWNKLHVRSAREKDVCEHFERRPARQSLWLDMDGLNAAFEWNETISLNEDVSVNEERRQHHYSVLWVKSAHNLGHKSACMICPTLRALRIKFPRNSPFNFITLIRRCRMLTFKALHVGRACNLYLHAWHSGSRHWIGIIGFCSRFAVLAFHIECGDGSPR